MPVFVRKFVHINPVKDLLRYRCDRKLLIISGVFIIPTILLRIFTIRTSNKRPWKKSINNGLKDKRSPVNSIHTLWDRMTVLSNDCKFMGKEHTRNDMTDLKIIGRKAEYSVACTEILHDLATTYSQIFWKIRWLSISLIRWCSETLVASQQISCNLIQWSAADPVVKYSFNAICFTRFTFVNSVIVSSNISCNDLS